MIQANLFSWHYPRQIYHSSITLIKVNWNGLFTYLIYYSCVLLGNTKSLLKSTYKSWTINVIVTEKKVSWVGGKAKEKHQNTNIYQWYIYLSFIWIFLFTFICNVHFSSVCKSRGRPLQITTPCLWKQMKKGT